MQEGKRWTAEKSLQSSCELGNSGSFYLDDTTARMRKMVTCCNVESGAPTGGGKKKLIFPMCSSTQLGHSA
ncbi:hypothetical protein NPIL_319991 [Nephila pilipes]|uniref:Uncharacterized protein n=1 Tax=Nephila pilipes TaxID=299642 RepID=A0A8X6NYG7_NEPPI|nr:hypothetical protein NPIL_319991 [Nephila pilipes]